MSDSGKQMGDCPHSWIKEDCLECKDIEIARLRNELDTIGKTCVKWAVAQGGNTPLAIIGRYCRMALGQEPPLPETVACKVCGCDLGKACEHDSPPHPEGAR